VLATGQRDQPLSLWDTTTGKELGRCRGYRSKDGQVLGFSPDGRLLASSDLERLGEGFNLWDVASGERVRPAGEHQAAVSCLAISPDGPTVATGSWDHGLRLWQANTGQEVRRLEGHENAVLAAAFSPDGKALASGDDGGAVRLWDAAGRPRWRWQGRAGAIVTLLFLPKRGELWAGTAGGAVVMLDGRSGKELRRLRAGGEGGGRVVLSPSGMALAVVSIEREWGSGDGLTLKRVAADSRLVGVRLQRQPREGDDRPGDGIQVWTATFSPDGRLLASSESCSALACRGPAYHSHSVRVWEVASGQEILARPLKTSCASLAFSPDGRVLACGADPTRPNEEKGAVLWDLDTGREAARLKGHDASVHCLSFAPDSKAVVTGSADRTALSWRIPSAPRPPAERLSEQALEGLWADLAGDAPRAWRAVARLSASPAEVVRFLGERLRPEPGVEANRLKQLVIDLDSARFAVRQRAVVELERLGELAEPALRQTLQGEGSLEYRRRVELLLQKIETPALVPERMRSLRALVVLERAGCPEAVRLLQALSQGAPGAQLTNQARAALSRLAARRETGKG
jgi:WD40 repeat protein